MTLVVGLGNIGVAYENTRHNVGFKFIDLLLKTDDFSKESSKFKGELYKKGSLLLLKPSTFINLSGICVKAVSDFYKPEHIIVVHDDLDLAFGAVKFKNGGSSGGHNGIKSIDTEITNTYDRIRIGIGHPKLGLKDYVLSNFSNEEKTKLSDILSHCEKALDELIKTQDIFKIASKFTLKVKI